MASRANISPTWYTWLEQGRGGAPSADVLDRLAALVSILVKADLLVLLSDVDALYTKPPREPGASGTAR